MLPHLSSFLVACLLFFVDTVFSQPEFRDLKWAFDKTFNKTGDDAQFTVSVQSENPSLGRCVFFDYSEAGKLWCIRRKEHIVFVGDSIVRFQYLALVYAIHFGRPLPTNGRKYDFLTRHHPDITWSQFLAETTSLFSPYMKCDCQCGDTATYLHEMNENRYYYHPLWNISVTYLASFGTASELRGQWAPPTSKYASGNVDFLPNPVLGNFIPKSYVWVLGEPEAHKEIIAHLEPKPTVIINNRGLHGEVSREDVQSVYDAATQITNCVIWKTTTSPGMAFRNRWPVLWDEHAKAIYDIILDTRLVMETHNFTNDDHMWDHHHFYGHVYNYFNEELFRVLSTHERCSGDGQYSETIK